MAGLYRLNAPAWLLGLALSLGSGSLSGCAKNRPSCDFVPESANLIIESGERLNPDESGRSLPTVVRLYQLSSVAALESATFEQVWRTPAEALGETLLAQDEFVLFPAERQERSFERNPEASYVVGVAVFRRPTGASWRSVLALPLPAAAQRCLAQQEDAEDEAAEPPSPIVHFRLEDFAIRGALGFDEPARSPCGAADDACRAGLEAAAAHAPAPAAP